MFKKINSKLTGFCSALPLVATAKAKISDYTNIWTVICKPDNSDPDHTDLGTIMCTVTNATKLIFDIAGVIAFIMILYASILYLTSYGEESRAEMAKKTLIWSVVGVIVVILARSVLIMIYKAVSNPTAPTS